MSKTKTPRTDMQTREHRMHSCKSMLVSADFARQLETELNEARAEIERLKKDQESDAKKIAKYILREQSQR